MKKKILKLVGAVVVVCMAVTSVLMGGTMYAEAATDVCHDSKLDAAQKAAAGCNDFKDKTKTAVPIALNLINVAVGLVGLLSVGVIVYGGILYTTSLGDASKATKAKNCILYGVVGLVVAVMAFAIVSFVNTSVLQK